MPKLRKRHKKRAFLGVAEQPKGMRVHTAITRAEMQRTRSESAGFKTARGPVSKGMFGIRKQFAQRNANWALKPTQNIDTIGIRAKARSNIRAAGTRRNRRAKKLLRTRARKAKAA